MQGVAISKIPGALVKEIAVPDSEPLNSNIRGYNQCRSEMSQVKIGLKREELAKRLFAYKVLVPHITKKDIQHHWDLYPDVPKESFYNQADYLIQALPDLLTVVTDSFTGEGKE